MEKNAAQQILLNGLGTLNIAIEPNKIEQWLEFLALLRKWNKAFNLTAITKPQDMITHHLLDSLAIWPHLHKTYHVDVGTGAGIPGIPLAILLPNHHFSLLDSVGKKTRFIEQVKQSLNLTNVTVINQRAEDYKPEQLFDTVITRAFASLAKMLTLTSHLLNKDGVFLAMKGNLDNEVNNIPPGYQINMSERLKVPGLDATRHIILIQRESG